MDPAAMEKLLEGPGLKPPPGIIPNFINPPSLYGINIAVNSTCLIVATICVAIRAYTKFVIMRIHGWEDYTCFIAFLGLIVYVALLLSPISRTHAGVHQWDIQGKTLILLIQGYNAIEIAYVPVIFIAKLSILLLYLRVFVPGVRTKTYWAIQFVILFNLLFYVSNLPVEIWPCVPRSKLWNPTEAGHCINNEAVFVAGGSINMISDFMILLIPIVSIWRLQMPRNRRIGVSAVFATGIFGCVASIMHLVTSVASARSDDKTYYLYPVGLWTLAEITSAIVCSCLITTPNFFRHFAPKLMSKLSHSSTPYNNHSGGKGGAHNNNKIASFVPVRARPEDWSGYRSSEEAVKPLRDTKDTSSAGYMELGETAAWPSAPPAAHQHQHQQTYETIQGRV